MDNVTFAQIDYIINKYSLILDRNIPLNLYRITDNNTRVHNNKIFLLMFGENIVLK